MDVDATFTGAVIGALLGLWIGTAVIAFRLQKKQTEVQMRLQDREVEWSLYCHLLRLDYIQETNKEPREIPEKLLPFPHDDPHIDKF